MVLNVSVVGWYVHIRYHSRFFVQVGHETINASMKNWWFPIAAYVVSCPTCTKNLEWYLKHICMPLQVRVSKVVADHNSHLTQWRYIQISKFSANIFLIQTTSNYFWADKNWSFFLENKVFLKIEVFKNFQWWKICS